MKTYRFVTFTAAALITVLLTAVFAHEKIGTLGEQVHVVVVAATPAAADTHSSGG